MNNKIILGTVQFGLGYGINNAIGKPSKNNIFKILDHAYENNILTLDTAPSYGDAMKTIGSYHKLRLHRFKVISKFKSNNNINIIDEVNQSLEILNIDKLEALLMHDSVSLTNLQLIKDLTYLKKEKKIKNIGISIYTNEEFEQAITLPEINIIQIPYNLLDNWKKRGDLILKAKLNHKNVHVRSIFLQGLFFIPPFDIPNKLEPLKTYLHQIEVFCKKNNISKHAAALKYPLNNKNISGVLIGVDSLEQLKEDIFLIKNNFDFDKNIVEIEVKEIDLLNPSNWN